MNVLRERIRRQLAAKYRRDLREGHLTAAKARELLDRLQEALEKAKRTNRRVTIEGQEALGTLSEAEIEDQLSALRRVL